MKKPFLKRKLFYVLTGLILLLIVVRAVMPSLILNHLNNYLGTFSPLYSIHIRDLKIQVWRMAYSFNDVGGFLKKDAIEFAAIKKIDVSLAWREIFNGRFVADIDINQANLKITKESLNAISGYDPKQVKSDAKNVKDKTVPFNIERLVFTDSSFLFADIASLPPEQNFQLSGIHAIANNLTPQDKNAMTVFTATGAIQGNAKIKLVGQARTKREPADWSINTELKEFDLSKINPIAWRTLPISFKKGKLSVFSAVQSLNGKLRGYVKPFIKDMEAIGDKRDFKNVGQFFIEILSSVGNFILKNGKTDTVATRVNFHSENGKVVVDTAQAISTALDNAFGDPLPPSLDETLDLTK